MPNKSTQASPLRKKLDHFWVGLFLTPEGRPKSAKLLYSFCLSIVFMAVYGLCYWFLIGPLHTAFAANHTVELLATAVIPGLCGSIVCGAFWFVFKDKSYPLTIYIWLIVYALAALAGMLFVIGRDGEMLKAFFSFFAQLVPTGLLSGAALSWYMYARWRRNRPAQNE
ncbi:MAG: hypothetical protein LBN26_10435 [Christensenellaceae bacterium]|jgi:hypothetical protein|nr:hypothetical protein [Christensenellaceae bacterium]